MSVLVRFGKHKAILRAGRWVSADVELEQRLNQTTTAWIRETGGPPVRERDQERGVAVEIAGRLGGRILIHMRTRSRRSKDEFFAQRQMELDFTSGAGNPGGRASLTTSSRR